MSEEVIRPLPVDPNPVISRALVDHFDLLIQRLQMEAEWLRRQNYDEQARFWMQARTDLMKVRAFYKEYCLEK